MPAATPAAAAAAVANSTRPTAQGMVTVGGPRGDDDQGKRGTKGGGRGIPLTESGRGHARCCLTVTAERRDSIGGCAVKGASVCRPSRWTLFFIPTDAPLHRKSRPRRRRPRAPRARRWPRRRHWARIAPLRWLPPHPPRTVGGTLPSEGRQQRPAGHVVHSRPGTRRHSEKTKGGRAPWTTLVLLAEAPPPLHYIVRG